MVFHCSNSTQSWLSQYLACCVMNSSGSGADFVNLMLALNLSDALTAWVVALLFSSPLYPCPKRLVNSSTIPIVLNFSFIVVCSLLRKAVTLGSAGQVHQAAVVGSIGLLVRKELSLSPLP
jgi:hypothetical protein